MVTLVNSTIEYDKNDPLVSDKSITLGLTSFGKDLVLGDDNLTNYIQSKYEFTYADDALIKNHCKVQFDKSKAEILEASSKIESLKNLSEAEIEDIFVNKAVTVYKDKIIQNKLIEDLQKVSNDVDALNILVDKVNNSSGTFDLSQTEFDNLMNTANIDDTLYFKHYPTDIDIENIFKKAQSDVLVSEFSKVGDRKQNLINYGVSVAEDATEEDIFKAIFKNKNIKTALKFGATEILGEIPGVVVDYAEGVSNGEGQLQATGSAIGSAAVTYLLTAGLIAASAAATGVTITAGLPLLVSTVAVSTIIGGSISKFVDTSWDSVEKVIDKLKERPDLTPAEDETVEEEIEFTTNNNKLEVNTNISDEESLKNLANNYVLKCRTEENELILPWEYPNSSVNTLINVKDENNNTIKSYEILSTQKFTDKIGIDFEDLINNNISLEDKVLNSENLLLNSNEEIEFNLTNDLLTPIDYNVVIDIEASRQNGETPPAPDFAIPQTVVDRLNGTYTYSGGSQPTSTTTYEYITQPQTYYYNDPIYDYNWYSDYRYYEKEVDVCIKGINDPIAIDLDGDGIETTDITSTSTFFDLDGDNFAEKTGWIAPDDGLLVMDNNSNGTIDDITELFGSSDQLGFDALAELDSNYDGVINSSDTQFSSLNVWQDSNSNGLTDDGELKTLTEAGIQSINLSYQNTDIEQGSNKITQISSYTKINSIGVTNVIADVELVTNNLYTRYNGEYVLDIDVIDMPWVRGYGKVVDLQLAASQNDSLKTLISELVQITDAHELYGRMDEVLAKWVGVESIPAENMTGAVNSRELEIVGNFLNLNTNGNSVPEDQKILIEKSYDEIKNKLYVDFIAQTQIGADFEIAYDYLTDSIAYNDNTYKNIVANLIDRDNFFASYLITKALHNAGSLDPNKLTAAIFEAGYGSALYNYLNEEFQVLDSGEIVALNPSMPHYIIGTDGGDTIIGGEGIDVIYGMDGDDLIKGAGANDLLLGGDGNDTIYGGTEDDTLSGGAGDNYLYGETGNDTYIFEGTGQDVITDENWVTVSKATTRVIRYVDWSIEIFGIVYEHWTTKYETSYAYSTQLGYAGNDTVLFGKDIKPNDLTLARAVDDLVIQLNGTDKKLTVKNWYATDQQKVEKFVFSDGFIMTMNNIEHQYIGNTYADNISASNNDDFIQSKDGNDFITALNGNDFIISGTGNDTVNAGIGNDQIYDNSGDDEYQYASGDGHDVIKDNAGTDKIKITGGLTEDDIDFARVNTDLVLTVENENHTITIKNWFTSDNNKIESFEFDNQDNLTANDIKNMLSSVSGSAFDDNLYGSTGNDSINALGGDDFIETGNGNDTLDGGLGNDVLKGGAGNDLYKVDSPNDIITEEVNEGTDIVESTSSFELPDNVENITLLGSGNINAIGNHSANVITGNSGNNIIEGKEGVDTLQGGAGDDTYIITNLEDTIIENTGEGSDTVRSNFSYTLNEGNNIENIDLQGFDDINAIGNSLDNVLAGNTGNNILSGMAGNDEYIFGIGSGQDTITETSGADKISFEAGITKESIILTRENNDLKISINETTDKLTLSNYYLNDASKVETLYFSDNTQVDLSDIIIGTDNADSLTGNNSNNCTYGYSGNDTITDSYGNDTIYGGAGNDSIIIGVIGDSSFFGDNYIDGGAGNDYIELSAVGSYSTIYGGAGDDTINIRDGLVSVEAGTGNDLITSYLSLSNNFYYNLGDGLDTISDFDKLSSTDIIHFGDGISSDDVTFIRNDLDLLIYINSADQLTIQDWYKKTNYQIEQFAFANGSTMSKSDIVLSDAPPSDNTSTTTTPSSSSNEIIGTYASDILIGTSDNDTITDSYGDDTIYGGSGNDSITVGVIGDSSFFGNNFIDGEAGNDFIEISAVGSYSTIYGGAGDDTINIRDGYVSVEAGTGNDLITSYLTLSNNFYYNLGDGLDTISDFDKAASTDIIHFGEGISPDNVTFIRRDLDLLIYINSADQLTIQDWYKKTNYQIEQFAFANGSTMSKFDIVLSDFPNDAPTASSLSATTDEDNSVTINGLSGVIDLNGDTLNIEPNPTAANGIVSVAGSNLVYTPNENFNGTDTINYTISDGNGGTVANTISLTVNPINDAPTVSSLSATVDTNSSVTIDGLSGTSDADGDTLSIEPNPTATNGIVSVAGSNLVYTPNTDFDGTDIISYTISDGNGGTIVNTVDITINPLNAAPTEILGTAASDVLTGGAGNDTITDSYGNDTIYGGAGDDSITVGVIGDSSFFGDNFIDGEAGNDFIEISAVSSYSTIYGGAGDDTINVRDGLVSIHAGKGNDLITCYLTLSNNFYYNLGDGFDTISDFDKAASTDVIHFGEGISPEDITFIRNGYDLIFHINATDQLTIQNWYKKTNYQMEQFAFANGSIRDRSDIVLSDINIIKGTDDPQVLNGTAGVDGLYGYGGSDTINGGLGNDSLYGDLGNDIYQFSLNDNQDIIYDASGFDQIQFDSDVVKDNIAVYQDGSDLYLDYGTTVGGDKIAIIAQNTNTIEQLKLSNGEYLTSSDVNQVIQDITAYADANSIALTSVEDVKNNSELMNIITGAWHT